MANEVEIVVTAKDDSKKALTGAEKNVKGVGDAAEKSGTKVKGFGDDAERAGTKVKGLGDDANRTQTEVGGLGARLGSGGADLRAYGKDLDGVGDGFNDVEDRAMGAGNIINGVGDMMTAADPATFAMGLSDTAAGMRYTVVPTFQDLGKSVKGVLDRMKAGGGITAMFRRNMAGIVGVAGAAAAGIGLVTMHIQDNNRRQEEARQRAQEWADQLKELNGDQDQLLRNLVSGDAKFAHLRSVLNDANMSTAEFAAQLQDGSLNLKALAEDAGLSAGETTALYMQVGILKSGLEGATGAVEDNSAALRSEKDAAAEAADALSNYSDAVRAQFDPVFGMIDAQQSLRDAQLEVASAQKALNEAQAEGDPTAIAEAQRAYDDALHGASEALVGAESAQAGLNAEAARNPDLINNAKDALYQWAINAGYTAEEARRMTGQLDGATFAAQVLDAQNPRVQVAVDGTGAAISNLAAVTTMVNAVPKDVTIRIATEVYGQAELNRARALRDGQAHGGIIGAASGGVRNRQTLVGERGPELVDLPVGSTVTPAASTRAKLAGGGGGGGPVTVEINLRGGDRELMNWLRRQIRVTHGGNVQQALGR